MTTVPPPPARPRSLPQEPARRSARLAGDEATHSGGLDGDSAVPCRSKYSELSDDDDEGGLVDLMGETGAAWGQSVGGGQVSGHA